MRIQNWKKFWEMNDHSTTDKPFLNYEYKEVGNWLKDN